jgi:predicted phosphohydrolase
VRSLEVDVLVVAGDVSSDPETVERTLSTLRTVAPAGVYIPGNHDLWCSDGRSTSRERYETLLPMRVRSAGFVPLGSQPAELGDLAFVGVTGWYDYSLRNRDLDERFSLEDYRRGAHGRLRWSDKARVRWPDDDGRELEGPALCDEQVGRLARQLDEVAGRPTVVVTHHLPFIELVTSFRELPWDFINGFMGSARLGEAIMRTPGVRLVCSGHTHFLQRRRFAGKDGSFEAVVSPIGYPREYERAGQSLAERIGERVTLIELGGLQPPALS